jgi:FtsP/CotA-like multicopper oxidase with cupredoxin domain
MSSIDRRTLLRASLTLGGAGALAGCARDRGQGAAYVSPTGGQVRAAEARRKPGTIRDFHITATAGTVDLDGQQVRTWTYGGELPGPAVRVRAGEVVRARLTNRLPAETTVHWHGLSLRNDADGVPDITQAPIKAGAEHTYEFTAPVPGTYWFHPHSGTQLDRGLYAALIVEDPQEPLDYDEEWVVILDDWLDGVTGTPDEVLAELGAGGGHGGGHGMPTSPGSGGGGHGGHAGPGATTAPGKKHMLMGATSPLLGGDAGDVLYPYFLLNGRPPTAPETFGAKVGSRLRIRFINAGGDTAFRAALGDHQMTITHCDGYPVRHTPTDAVLIGMGERYDVLVTLKSGAFPLVALAEGKDAVARAVIRTSKAASAPGDQRPVELDGRLAGYDRLRPADPVRLADKRPSRTVRMELTGGMMRYDWGINGRKFDPKTIYPVRSGERVRLAMVNRTPMWHPMHLHGHTFALAENGLRKDTAIVLPKQTLEVDFDADNPGVWMIHCHNVYHAEAGMMALLGYRL